MAGKQKITTFLWFDNNAEEAMNHYVSIFKDSKIHRSAAAGASRRRPREIRESVSVSMSTRSPAGTFACGRRPMLRYG